jgi:hypothetical protein
MQGSTKQSYCDKRLLAPSLYESFSLPVWNNLNSPAKTFVKFLQVCACVDRFKSWLNGTKITDTSPEDPSPIRTICIILVNVFIMVAMVSIFFHSYCKFTSVILGTVAICITKFERKHLPILVQIEQNNVLYISDLLLFDIHGSKIVWNTRWSIECSTIFVPILTTRLSRKFLRWNLTVRVHFLPSIKHNQKEKLRNDGRYSDQHTGWKFEQ